MKKPAAKFVEVNEHKLAPLPEGMTVYKATHKFPGDYDCLNYGDWELCTFEDAELINGLYVGPFGMNRDGGEIIIVPTLAAAILHIKGNI